MERIIDTLRANAYTQYDWDWNICKRIEAFCLDSKSELIDLLSKHPLWDAENYRIHFNTDFNRVRDTEAAAISAYKLLFEISSWLMTFSALDERATALYHVTRDLLGDNRHLFTAASGIIESSDAGYVTLLTRYPEMRLHAGAKCTKSLLKILRQYGYEDPEIFTDAEALTRFRRLYAEYADAMTPLSVTRHTVLSVNPNDFLLMSNGVSWQSCHDIRHDGCYQGGCWSYAYDRQTMIFYTLDAEVADEDITYAKKIYRQLYHWNGSLLYGARLYPQSNDVNAESEYRAFREVVEQIIATCLDAPNLWKKADHADFASYGVHYRDYNQSYCSDLHAYHLSSMPIETNEFIIGSGDPICPVCGDSLVNEECDEEEAEHIVCLKCADKDMRECDRCGDVVSEDELTYLDRYNRYVCNYCLDNHYYWSSVMHCYLDDYEAEAFTDKYGCTEYATEDWLRDNDYACCENCGVWEHINRGVDTEDGHFYCKDCADDCAYQCDDCGCWYSGACFETDDGRHLCDACFAKYEEASEVPCPICGSLHKPSEINWNGERYACIDCLDEREVV